MKKPYYLTKGASQSNAFTAHMDGTPSCFSKQPPAKKVEEPAVKPLAMTKAAIKGRLDRAAKRMQRMSQQSPDYGHINHHRQ